MAQEQRIVTGTTTAKLMLPEGLRSEMQTGSCDRCHSQISWHKRAGYGGRDALHLCTACTAEELERRPKPQPQQPFVPDFDRHR